VALIVRIPLIRNLTNSINFLKETVSVPPEPLTSAIEPCLAALLTYPDRDLAIWTVLEPSLGIIAGCAATMRPLLKAWGLCPSGVTKPSRSHVHDETGGPGSSKKRNLFGFRRYFAKEQDLIEKDKRRLPFISEPKLISTTNLNIDPEKALPYLHYAASSASLSAVRLGDSAHSPWWVMIPIAGPKDGIGVWTSFKVDGYLNFGRNADRGRKANAAKQSEGSDERVLIRKVWV